MSEHQFCPITERVLDLSSLEGLCDNIQETDFGFVLGLLERSRRLLEALLLLNRHEYPDCGEGICRSILEHTATGFWVLEDLEKRFEIVLRAHVRDLRIQSDLGSQNAKELHSAFASMVEERWGNGTQEAKLPPLEQRLIGPLSRREVIYRELCARLHSSVLSGAMGSISIAKKELKPVPLDRSYEAGYLPLSTILVWGLSARLALLLDLPAKDALQNMASEFVAYSKSDGQGAWSLR